MRQVFFIFLTVWLVSCSPVRPQTEMDKSSKGSEQVPRDFSPAKGILLIEESVESDNSTVSVSDTYTVPTDTYMNAYMRKNRGAMMDFADKHYTYKHQFATQSEIYTDVKYKDKDLYRYAIVTSITKPNQYTRLENGTFKSTHYQPIFKFYLYDRLNDKTYAALGNGSSLIMWAFKSSIEKLNAAK